MYTNTTPQDTCDPLTHIQTGDIIQFTRKHISAAVKAPDTHIETLSPSDGPTQPANVDLVWIDGYSMTPSRGIPLNALHTLFDNGKITLLLRGVQNGWDALRMADDAQVDSQNPADRDTAVQIGPRLRVSDLSFERTYSLNHVNGFLKHPVVDHKHGRVQKAKALFVARRPDGRPAAVLTLNSPNARNAFDRQTVEITRYASHPATASATRTNNTATWMLSHVCDWAALEGYDTIRTLAGTDGNDGSIYQAANFTSDGTANSSGTYNRDGRQNFTHTHTLKRYIKDIDCDGDNASPGLPRRFDSRMKPSESPRDQTTTLSQFHPDNSPSNPPTKEFRYTREDATDTKFTTADTDNQYPVFSTELTTLITDTDSDVDLSTYRHGRGPHTPAAVFGAAITDSLMTAAIVTGNPRESEPTAHVEEYISRPTQYPDRSSQWLFTRIRDWAELNTYQSVRIPADTLTTADHTSQTAPQAVGFSQTHSDDSSHTYLCD